MRTNVVAELAARGEWLPAELTDDRGYSHPVIVLQGERIARGPMEVVMLRPVVGSDEDLLAKAELAGYAVSHEDCNHQ